jgi:hypothetical protein
MHKSLQKELIDVVILDTVRHLLVEVSGFPRLHLLDVEWLRARGAELVPLEERAVIGAVAHFGLLDERGSLTHLNLNYCGLNF